MKKTMKFALLGLLLIVSMVLIVIPANVQQVDAIEDFPGIIGKGPYGWTCYCPAFVECGCAFLPPPPG
jgi:hypothetical protein